MIEDFAAKYPDLPIISTVLKDYLRNIPIPSRRKKEIWIEYCEATRLSLARDDVLYIMEEE